MTLFGGRLTRRSLESPTTPINDDSVRKWLGGGQTASSGIVVNETVAMNTIPVYRAVTTIAGSAGSLPLRLYKAGDSRQLWTGFSVANDPHMDMTEMEFWELLYTHCLTWGNHYSLKRRDNAERIKYLEPISPALVEPFRDKPTAESPSGKFFVVQSVDGPRILSPYDVFHVPAPTLDGIKGLSPLAAARDSIGVTLAAQEHAGRLFANGSMVGGILRTEKELTQEQAETLKMRWRERSVGLARAHDIAVLDQGANFERLGMDPESTQLLASRVFGVEEIARLYGVPAHLMGLEQKSTSYGTGVEQAAIGFVTWTLRNWIRRVEGRINKELMPRGTYAEFIVEGLLRGDTDGRYSANASALAAGWQTVNEVRRRENLPPVPGGDALRVPLASAPLAGSDKADPDGESAVDSNTNPADSPADSQGDAA